MYMYMYVLIYMYIYISPTLFNFLVALILGSL